jgi:hypothetical protein
MKMTLALTAMMMCMAGTAFAGDKMTNDKMESDKMMTAPAMEKKDAMQKKDAMMAPKHDAMMAPAMKKDDKAMDQADKMKMEKDKM